MQGLNGGRVNIGTSTLLHTWYLTSDVTWVTCFFPCSIVFSRRCSGKSWSCYRTYGHSKTVSNKVERFPSETWETHPNSRNYLHVHVGSTFCSLICGSTCNFESPKCRRLSSRHDFSCDKQPFRYKNLEKIASLSAPWPNSLPPNTALTSEPNQSSLLYQVNISFNPSYSVLILGLQLSSPDLWRLWLLKRLPCTAILARLASTPNTRRFVTSRLQHTKPYIIHVSIVWFQERMKWCACSSHEMSSSDATTSSITHCCCHHQACISRNRETRYSPVKRNITDETFSILLWLTGYPFTQSCWRFLPFRVLSTIVLPCVVLLDFTKLEHLHSLSMSFAL